MDRNETSKALALVQSHERRAAKRMRVISGPVSVNHNGTTDPAFCENISDRGMQLRFASSLDVSDAIIVIFHDDAWIPGRVVWQREGHCGIAFDAPIDSALYLYNYAGLNSPDLAVGRLPVVSTNRHRFREGLHVRVGLATGEECRGLIHWNADEIASLELLR